MFKELPYLKIGGDIVLDDLLLLPLLHLLLNASKAGLTGVPGKGDISEIGQFQGCPSVDRPTPMFIEIGQAQLIQPDLTRLG